MCSSDLQPVFFGQCFNFLPARGAVDEDALCVLVTEDDVVEDRHCLDQHEVLMHHADAELDRLTGRIDADLLPIEATLALGRLIAVSSTHLDVYKRQGRSSPDCA